MSPVIDAQQRLAALNPHESVAVTAPAGSGKTELLTRRVLTLLAGVEKPENILAITFTRKAASEMRQRILAALQLASDDAPAEEYQRELWEIAGRAMARNAQMGWHLLENPNRLRIQTIDSFCMSLVRQMPLLSGAGSELSISDHPERLYQQAVHQLFEQFAEGGPALDDLKQLAAHLDNNLIRLEALLCSVLGKREQWLRNLVGQRTDMSGFRANLEEHLQCLILETLSGLKSQLQFAATQLLDTLRFAAAHLEPDRQPVEPDAPQLPDATLENLARWQRISNLLLTRSGTWRAKLTKNEGFPSAPDSSQKTRYSEAKREALALIGELSEHDHLRALMLEVRTLPAPEYDKSQWVLLGCLSNLLPQLVAELRLVFRETGEVDHQQVTMAALDALGHHDTPGDVSLLLDYRLQHILVDEFQDTSSAQFELFARLTESWQPGDGKTFFIVGDGMQSCYGFRDANVGLFLAAKQFGIGQAKLQPIDLEVNFRSQQAIVGWVNEAFKEAFPEQDDIARGAVSYSPSTACHPPLAGHAVSFYACIDDPERIREADQVLQLVRQYRAEAPNESIAILVRNRAHLATITPLLNQHSIAWSGVDLEPLTDKPLILDLLALTRALLNPADRIAWLAILRAPWCGLSLQDLLTVSSQDNHRQPVWMSINQAEIMDRLSSAGRLATRRLSDTLDAAFVQRCRKPLRQWIEGVWLALGGPATASSYHELKQADVYFELLENYQENGQITDFDQFNTAVEKIYAQPEEVANAIQIMTIHKAKGLEFDRVILPGLDRSSRPQQNELLLQHERLSTLGESQLLISPISASGEGGDQLYEYLKQEQKLKNDLESTRLAYVAATRAIKKLALLACLKCDPKTEELVAPSKGSLLHRLWAVVKPQARIMKPENRLVEELSSTGLNKAFKLVRLEEGWMLPELPQGNILRPYRGHEYPQQPDDWALPNEQDWVKRTCRELFYTMDRQGISVWARQNQKRLPVILERYGGARYQSTLTEVLVIIETALKDPQAQWLFSGQHEDYLSGREILLNSEPTPFKVRLPHSFISEGIRWVVDLNLGSQHDPKQSAEQIVYLSQCAEGLKQLMSEPVKAALYYPRSRELIEL